MYFTFWACFTSWESWKSFPHISPEFPTHSHTHHRPQFEGETSPEVSAVLWMRWDKFIQKSCGGKGMTRLLFQWKKEPACPLPGQASIGFNLHRNTGCIHKAHQSLSGSNDQTIDNIQWTMRAYSESGIEWCQRAIKLWETNSFPVWTLII